MIIMMKNHPSTNAPQSSLISQVIHLVFIFLIAMEYTTGFKINKNVQSQYEIINESCHVIIT